MLTVKLSASETALWQGDPQWKAGFLVGLARGAGVTVNVAVVEDDQGNVLAQYAREWKPV